jgi:hypothetical protein
MILKLLELRKRFTFAEFDPGKTKLFFDSEESLN